MAQNLSYLAGLNTAQLEAVTHSEGPLLILAGAGTGKTKVITTRMFHLISSGAAKPSEILALTFGEKATAEMIARMDMMMPLGYEEVWIKTFHGFCERVLRERGHEIGLDSHFRILSTMDQWIFLRKNLFRFPLKYYRPLGNPAKHLDMFLSYFGRLKDEYIHPDVFLTYAEKCLADADKSDAVATEEATKQHELAQLYSAYQEAMASEGVMDFGDLVYYTLRLLEERPSVLKEYREQFRYIMVDEFQDTNYVQTRLALLLAREHGNIVVVGDDDQSIYRWRGASLSNIEQFQQTFPETKRVVLLENYRSRQEILDGAYKLIQNNNPNRLEVKTGLNKRLVAMGDFGGVGGSARDAEQSPVELRVFDSYLEEVGTIVQDIARGVAHDGRSFRDYAILTRTNAHLKPYTDELIAHGVPFVIRSAEDMLGFDEVKDLIAVLRVLTDPYDTVAMYRVLTMQIFGLSVQSVYEILQMAKMKHVSVIDVLREKKNAAQSSLFDGDSKELAVLALFEHLFAYAGRHTPSHVFLEFLEKSGYLRAVVDAVDSDSQRKLGNINSFAKLVSAFEKNERKNSLFDLMDYLNIIERAEVTFGADEADTTQDAVQLLTAHSAKGLEFPVVYIVSLVQNRFPSTDKKDSFAVPSDLIKDIVPEEASHIEEERRLMYVGMTRAKERLMLSYAQIYEGKRKWKPSVFLNEVFGDTPPSSHDFAVTSSSSLTPPDEKIRIDLPQGISIPLNKLSYTQFDTFKTCPLKYAYRHLLSVPTPPGHASSYGTSIHSTLNVFYQDIKNGISPTLAHLLELFEKYWVGAGYESRGHEEKRKQEGRDVLAKFFELNGQPQWIIPAFLEKPFSLKIGSARVTGRIDRIDLLPDGTYEVIDYKTGSSKKDSKIDKDLQLSLYALACRESLGINVSKLSLYFIDDNTKVSTTRNDEQLESCRDEVSALVDAMKKSDFTPTPGRHCVWCDFRLICPA